MTDALGLADELRNAVTDELLAHGEFSSSGNNRPNAEIAAQAVIDIVHARLRSSPSAVREAPAVSTGEVAWRYRFPNEAWRYVEKRPAPYRTSQCEPLYASLPVAKAAGDDRTCAENAQVASGDVRAAVIEALEWYAKDYDHALGCSQWDGGAKARAALSQAPATDAAQPTPAPNGAGREALEAVYAELHTTAEYYASTMTGLPTGSAVSEWIENDLIPNIEETVAALASSPVVGPSALPRPHGKTGIRAVGDGQ